MNAKARTVGKATAVYARTSREFGDSDKVSIPQQVSDAKELARRLGLQKPDDLVLVDHDLSGTLPPEQWPDLGKGGRTGKPNGKSRPGFSAIVKAITDGRVGAVIVRKRNRITRSFEQHRRFARLCREHGVRLFCTHETSDPEGGDESHEFSTDILALLAEFQLRQVSSDVRAAKKYLRDNGMKNAPVRSVGYADGGHGKAVVVPSAAEIVKEAFRLCLAGENLTRIGTALDAKWNIADLDRPGVTAVHFSMPCVKKILSNPLYAGLVKDSSGNLIGSKAYPPIIDVATYRQAQDRLRALARVKSGNRYAPHLLGGVIRCAQCGSTLNCKPSRKDKDGVLIDNVYECVNKACQKGNKATGICERRWNHWASLFLSFDVRETGDSDEVNRLLLRRGQVEDNLQGLLADATLPLESSLPRERAYRDELAKIDRKLAEAKPSKSSTKAWESMDVLDRRQRIRSIVDSIEVGKKWVVVRFSEKAFDAFPMGRGEEALRAALGAAKVPLAFPVLGVRGKGTNYSKCLAPPDLKSADRMMYGVTKANGEPAFAPRWEPLPEGVKVL